MYANPYVKKFNEFIRLLTAFCSCVSTHKIGFAAQIHKFREHVSRNLYKGTKKCAQRARFFVSPRLKPWFQSKSVNLNHLSVCLAKRQLVAAHGDLDRIAQRRYLADIDLRTASDAHIHDAAAVAPSPSILRTVTVAPTGVCLRLLICVCPLCN